MESLKGTLSKPAVLSGSLTVNTYVPAYDYYDGETVVVPTTSDQLLATSNTIVRDDILVEKIPTYETANEFGVTFIIAS